MRRLTLLLLAMASGMMAQTAKLNTEITSGDVTATVRKFLFKTDVSGPTMATISVCAATKNTGTQAIDIALSYQKLDGSVEIKSSTVQIPSIQRDKPVCENFWLDEGRLLSVSFQEKSAPVVMSGFESPSFAIR